MESVVLFVLGSQRQSVVLKFFAYAAALLATGWCVANLKQFDDRSLWTGAGLGALLVFNAFWAHRLDAGRSQPPLRAEPTVFTLLAFANWLAATWFNTTEAHLPLALAAEAVALTFSIYLLRVREITLLGQFFLVFAQLAWLLHFLNVTPPWWNPLAIIAVTIGLSHWWQHQKILAISRNIFVCYSTVFALAGDRAWSSSWLHPLVHAPAGSRSPACSPWPRRFTASPPAPGRWRFADKFSSPSARGNFSASLVTAKPEWYFPLAPVAALGVLSFATVGWFARKPDSKAEVREPLLQIALVYRWIALAMSLLLDLAIRAGTRARLGVHGRGDWRFRAGGLAAQPRGAHRGGGLCRARRSPRFGCARI